MTADSRRNNFTSFLPSTAALTNSDTSDEEVISKWLSPCLDVFFKNCQFEGSDRVFLLFTHQI